MTEPSEFFHLKNRRFRNYSDGHCRMYRTAIALLAGDDVKPASILEVGAGIGYGLGLMLENELVGTYTGIEPNVESYTYLRSVFPQVNLINETFDNAEVEPADYTFCIEVIEHLDDAQVQPFLAKLRDKTLKNLFFSTPDSSRSSHGKYTTATWVSLLRDAGFDVAACNRQWTTFYLCQ